MATVGFVALVCSASHAWGCVPQPLVTIQPTASGPSGTQVQLEGVAFNNDVPVEIRWNGTDGQLLAAATGPSFKSTMTVPPVAEGLYTVIALERLPGGAAGGTARAPFLVSGGHPSGGASGEGNTSARAEDSGPSPGSGGPSARPFLLLVPFVGLFLLALTASLRRHRRVGRSQQL